MINEFCLVSLKHSLDLRLLLSIGMEATASVNHVDWVSRVLNSAVINKDRMVEQMEGYTAQDHEKVTTVEIYLTNVTFSFFYAFELNKMMSKYNAGSARFHI